MNYREESLKKHAEWGGKIEVTARIPVNTRDDLSLAYTPGVAEPCLAIQADYNKSFELTRRSNLVAVVTQKFRSIPTHPARSFSTNRGMQ